MPTDTPDQHKISLAERRRIIDKAFNDAMRKVSAKLTAAKSQRRNESARRWLWAFDDD